MPLMISGVRRTVGNTVSVLTSDVVNRATTFVLYALVARYLGTFEFGQMSLALTFLYTFQVLAVAGLKALVTREVAKDRTKTDQYLINGSIVVAVSSLISISILLWFVWLINYSAATVSIIILVSLGLLPYALSAICEAVFQAWEQMHYIAYANVPVNIIKVSLVFLILSQDYSLYHLVMLLLGCHIAILGVEWWLILRYITRPQVRPNPRFSLAMIRSAGTFLGIDGLIAIWTSLNIILLSKLTNEIEVGLYSAAAQLMVPVILVCQSIVLSIYPIMCQRFDPSFQILKRIAEHLIELLLVIALPAVVGLFFLGDLILLLLYQDKEFLLVSVTLRIMVWELILRAFTSVLGQVLLASLREKVILWIVAINTLVNLVFGLILISQFGLIGAAITVLFTRIVDFCLHYVFVSRLLSNIALGKLVWKPVVAVMGMTIYLVMVRGQGVLPVVVTASIVYTGILLVLAIWSIGGVHSFKAKYRYFWPE